MLHSTIGGRDNGFIQYDQGRTLVHEMGHYLGLHHTFEGGSECLNDYQNGDLISDTNAESEPHFTCTQTTTCGTDDPIKNYMSYTNDTCMIQFTAEQANRMVCATMNYRENLFTLIETNNNHETSLAPVISYLLD